ncbi:CD209 antigen-like protein D [Oryzias melastigma]|uniref:CD209 antigen-like protein D n=1 Tax=Oryzias melastigma TaxID=30732 RepID=UPI000CF80E82|nr:CD209 antigen-like protein D [Oryzias melastigma]
MSAEQDGSDFKEREVAIYMNSDDVGVYYSLHQTEPQTPSRSAVQNESKTLLRLKVLCVLMAAGILIVSICCLLVSLENIKIKNSYNQLQTKLSDKKCPDRWMRFGSSCYYKSAFIASWEKSRIICQNQGSDLVIINNKVEQCFITNLNEKGESWIGLEVGWSSQKNKYGWKWLDGSPLAESFQKTENLQDPTDYFLGLYLNAEGKLKSLHKTHEKTFICEK